MAQRDKNNETASERIARKFMTNQLTSKDCNTRSLGHVLYLYKTALANVNHAKRTLRIFQFNVLRHDTMLTKSRVNALRLYARKIGYAIEDVY